jgi:crossover junction endodeoxyribonuclease RuvC
MIYSTFLGIDPGLSGAVAVLNAQGAFVKMLDMPTLEKGGYVRRRIDPWALAALLRPWCYFEAEVLACIESVGYRKGDAGASGASLAHSMGVAEGIVAGLGVRSVLRPLPQTWKQAMGVLKAGKQGAMNRARQLWPHVEFTRHDQAEAALLARFAFLNQSLPTIAPTERRVAKRAQRVAQHSRQSVDADDIGAWAVGLLDGEELDAPRQ